jgi:hypothetical protein
MDAHNRKQGAKDALLKLRSDENKKWLMKHSRKNLTSKFRERADLSNLLFEIKESQMYDAEEGIDELETNLLFAGVEDSTRSLLHSCGTSRVHCENVTTKLCEARNKELHGVRDIVREEIAHGDASAAHLNPITLLTRRRRKMVFHALLNTNEVDVNRERAQGILDSHITYTASKEEAYELEKEKMKEVRKAGVEAAFNSKPPSRMRHNRVTEANQNSPGNVLEPDSAYASRFSSYPSTRPGSGSGDKSRPGSGSGDKSKLRSNTYAESAPPEWSPVGGRSHTARTRSNYNTPQQGIVRKIVTSELEAKLQPLTGYDLKRAMSRAHTMSLIRDIKSSSGSGLRAGSGSSAESGTARLAKPIPSLHRLTDASMSEYDKYLVSKALKEEHEVRSFLPQFDHYAVMKNRWYSGVKPTPTFL